MRPPPALPELALPEPTLSELADATPAPSPKRAPDTPSSQKAGLGISPV